MVAGGDVEFFSIFFWRFCCNFAINIAVFQDVKPCFAFEPANDLFEMTVAPNIGANQNVHEQYGFV